MKRLKSTIYNFAIKYGKVLACCAFAFVVLSANSACTMPYYEPKAPMGLDKLKKFSI